MGIKVVTKPLYLITGMCGSGKSTIANAMVKQYDLKELQSYTTRTKRSEDEKGHTFVDTRIFNKKMRTNLEIEEHDFTNPDKIVAMNRTNGQYYWADYRQVCEADIYVIDPKGIVDLAQNPLIWNRVRLVVVDAPWTLALERMEKRGDKKSVRMERFYTWLEQQDKLAWAMQKLLADNKKYLIVKNYNNVLDDRFSFAGSAAREIVEAEW